MKFENARTSLGIWKDEKVVCVKNLLKVSQPGASSCENSLSEYNLESIDRGYGLPVSKMVDCCLRNLFKLRDFPS